MVRRTIRQPCLIDHDGVAAARAEAVFTTPGVNVMDALFASVVIPLPGGSVIEAVRPKYAQGWHVHERVVDDEVP